MRLPAYSRLRQRSARNAPRTTTDKLQQVLNAATVPVITGTRKSERGLTHIGIAEFAGLENDGVEQEETYILHTMK